MNTRSLIACVAACATIVLLGGLTLEGCSRSASRRQQVQLACIDKSNGNAEAVLCQDERRDGRR